MATVANRKQISGDIELAQRRILQMVNLSRFCSAAFAAKASSPKRFRANSQVFRMAEIFSVI
jgi:hypothetical protein